MKNNLTLLLLCLVFSLQAQQQCLPRSYMTQAMAKVSARALINSYSFNTGTSLLGGYIEVSKSLPFTITLNKGMQYAFIAGGDDDALDIDVFVENASGAIVARDMGASNDPEVLFTPSVTAQYTIKVKMYRSKASGSFAGLAIMQRGGYNIPLMSLANTLESLLKTVDRFCLLCDRVAFSNNQWAIFGSVVDEKEEVAIMNLQFEKGKRYTVIGAGDHHLEDGDLFLKTADGKTLKEDVEPDARPMIMHKNPERTENYEVVLKNIASDGQRSLCAFALLELNCN